MYGDESVMFTFSGIRKITIPAAHPNVAELGIISSGSEFVHMGLMRNVKNRLIVRGVENVM
jgi:hypothetical protein